MSDTVWNTPSIDINWGTTYPEIIPDIDPNWDINDWGIDFDGGGGTTGGNTDFWNQGLGGKLFDFGIAGATAGIGMSAMNQAQQAHSRQAELAAQAIRKGNIWSVGVQDLANRKEYESQKAAKLFNIAHLNDPNVIRNQKRKMLTNAAINNIDPKRAALYSILMT